MTIDSPPAIIHIMDDPGGTLGERMAVTAWLKRIGVRVEIPGVCGSSCYWLLGLDKDKICVRPLAWFGYHSAPGDANDRIRWERGYDIIARGMARACR